MNLKVNSLSFKTGGHCELAFQKPQGWLRATWTGLIGTEEALRGGQHYLRQVGALHCLYLLNDNTGLQGPWFDSLEWLKRIWLPQAERLGLRYVAHVVQADTHTDILTLHYHLLTLSNVELQLFHELAEAEEWLASCQKPKKPA